MPLWSLDEMKTLNRALSPPIVSASASSAAVAAPVFSSLFMLSDRELELRFFQWGGCVRSVFITSEDWNVQSLLDQMSSLENLEIAVGKIRATPTAFGRLIHLEVDPETFQVISLFSLFLQLISPRSPLICM